MISPPQTLLVLSLVVLVLLPSQTYAFGAGEIPDFAYLNGEAPPINTTDLNNSDVIRLH